MNATTEKHTSVLVGLPARFVDRSYKAKTSRTFGCAPAARLLFETTAAMGVELPCGICWVDDEGSDSAGWREARAANGRWRVLGYSLGAINRAALCWSLRGWLVRHVYGYFEECVDPVRINLIAQELEMMAGTDVLDCYGVNESSPSKYGWWFYHYSEKGS